MPNVQSSGIEPGQRRLNGTQTNGREYRNLSQPTHTMAHDDDVRVPMRDGVTLLADVHRPAESGRYPVLVAASPYPRQIQNLGAPAGFIEAGARDFFVPRGYVHVIASGAGSRTYMNLGAGINRPRAAETDPPPLLNWTTPPLPHDLDLIGPIELQLDATCTAPDTAFIAVLQDVDESENAINVTAGYLRAGLRGVDEAASKRGAPFLPCRTFEAVPVGEKVSYRIP